MSASPPRRRDLLGVLPTAAAILAVAVGVLVLGGWVFDVPEIVRLHAGWSPMKVNTAVCFILLGAALLALRNEPVTASQRVVGRGCAGLVLALGLVTLLERLFHVSFGLDRMIYNPPPTADVAALSTKMSPTTAFNLALFGLALLGLDWKTKQGRCPARALVLLPAILGLLTFTGYLFGAKALYATWPFSLVAMHTAALFMVLAVGILLARTGDGPLGVLNSEGMGSVMARWLLPLTVILPLTIGWLSLRGQLAGWYGFEFGLALFTVASITIFADLIWTTAFWLNRADRERRGAERAVRESSARYEGIVNSAMDGIIGKTLDGTITSWNHAAEDIFGYAAAEMIGQSVRRLIPPERQNEEMEILARVRRKERVQHYETVRRRKDGTLVEVSLSVSPILDEAGTVTGASKIVRDITGRKRAEMTLTLFRSLIDRSNDGIEIVDPVTARFLDVNEKTCSDLGYTREELLALKLFDIEGTLTAAGWPGELEKLRRVCSFSGEGFHRRKDGQTYPVEIRVRLVKLDREYIVAVVRDITERKQAEQALRESESKFRTLFDTASDAIFLMRKGKFVDCNARALEMFGRTREQIIGREPPLFSPPTQPDGFDSTEKVREKYNLANEGQTQFFDWVCLRGDGTPFYTEVSVSRLELDGELYLQAMVRDVTERKRAEEKLRHSEAMMAAAQRIAHFASWEMDLVSPELYANPLRWSDECYRIFGLEPRSVAVSAEFFFRCVPPEDHPAIHQAVADALAHGHEYSIDHRIILPDGEIRHVHEQAHIFVDERTGRPLKMLGTILDITERTRAEAARRESEERFRQIAENIHEVFWLADPANQQILYVNPAYEKIWGRPCASVYQNPHQWLETIHLDDRERIREAVVKKQAQGTYDEIYRISRPDGSIRWIRDRAYPVRNERGDVYRVVGTAEDITEGRKLEEQYRQSQKMEAIGTLAGGIAHDFNNILAAMNGYTELAKMLPRGDPKLGDYLDNVLKAGSRAKDLVQQILTFSRQQEQQRRRIQLAPVVEESLKLLRASIPSTIQFQITITPRLPTVLADPTQIHQIVMNLGTNAWHAMKDRTGWLRVNLENFVADAGFAEINPPLQPGPYVHLSVADTGCGMERAVQERIFEPFFTTKGIGEGTGLGLSVVHGIMQDHDGLITVYSTPGEGAIFHLYFPANAGPTAVPAAPAEATVSGAGKRVLFVDDEEMLARLGQNSLERLGYEVEARTSVAEALTRVRADPRRYDLVITDQTMPEMTGVEFAAALLKIRPDLPIILTTGYSPTLTAERVRALGIRELLLKPQTIQTLSATVQRALNGERVG